MFHFVVSGLSSTLILTSNRWVINSLTVGTSNGQIWLLWNDIGALKDDTSADCVPCNTVVGYVHCSCDTRQSSHIHCQLGIRFLLGDWLRNLVIINTSSIFQTADV